MYKYEKKEVIIWQEDHIIYQEIQNGESRFFNVFSPKALVATIILGLIGLLIFYPIGMIVNYKPIGVIMTVIFGAIGFVITSFKIPDSNNFELTRKAGGEYIYKIIIRYFKFKARKNKIYTFYAEDDKKKNNT